MDHEPLWARHHVAVDGLEVEVFTQPAVNLALVHNRVPLVQAVTVRNAGEQPQLDVTVTVSLHGQGAELSDPWSRTFEGELAPGEEFSWSDLGTVHPSYEHPAGLNESHPATLRVVASRTWGDDAELAVPIDVLAANEWLNAPIFYSSLAAFAQPNTRAVGAVLDAASDILREETKDASLGGYQKGPERAAQIAAAIYAALHRRGVRYIDPPASFEDTGQRFRTTAQVSDERFGACINLAVTYAACFEQAGLAKAAQAPRYLPRFGRISRDSAASHHPKLSHDEVIAKVQTDGGAEQRPRDASTVRPSSAEPTLATIVRQAQVTAACSPRGGAGLDRCAGRGGRRAFRAGRQAGCR